MGDPLYCLKCVYRRWQVIDPVGEVDVTKAITNKPGFCKLEYTQNPISLEGTLNALQNGAEICRFNPWRGITARKIKGGEVTWVKSLLQLSLESHS